MALNKLYLIRILELAASGQETICTSFILLSLNLSNFTRTGKSLQSIPHMYVALCFVIVLTLHNGRLSVHDNEADIRSRTVVEEVTVRSETKIAEFVR